MKIELKSRWGFLLSSDSTVTDGRSQFSPLVILLPCVAEAMGPRLIWATLVFITFRTQIIVNCSEGAFSTTGTAELQSDRQCPYLLWMPVTTLGWSWLSVLLCWPLSYLDLPFLCGTLVDCKTLWKKTGDPSICQGPTSKHHLTRICLRFLFTPWGSSSSTGLWIAEVLNTIITQLCSASQMQC